MSSPYAKRTMLVCAVWTLGVLPLLIQQRCPIARLAHHPCPGCGLTRAGMMALHGDFAGSLAMHPLLAPLLIAQTMLVFVSIGATWRFGAPWDLWRWKVGRFTAWLVGGVCVAMLVLWIARELGALGGPVSV